ncbi:sugar ABC transporter ATP-binding protein [Psychrobacillus sp. OK032]|uniref:sugar ABC transporter ATP-binding protein n=1 Tax=Psychrobacillus sp. OK032 TaxID=1884358 RepID=UPI0008D0089B|nr:sugar ABC transporter ATP-binding protein [Psychrobacillus sp. OK032]SER55994.1 monosaccharide ABC transporter ATP-binding protein, CUT2 family [Psychrobacillus sp. OK032]
MSEEYLLEIEDLHKQFNGNHVLSGINFTLKKGEIYAVVGGNGAGKSTLMKIITGLYKADSGEMEISGKRVRFANPNDAHKNGIYLVPQEPLVFPNMTIEENITMGLKGIGKPKELRKKILQVINRVGWSIDISRLGLTLSIAEQQLVEILRGLVREAQILILDEPTSTLTHNEIDSLFDTIRQLSDNGIGIIYITHRFSEIFELSHSVAVLRDGKISAQGPISEFSYKRLLDGLVPTNEQPSNNITQKKSVIQSSIEQIGATVLEIDSLCGNKFQDISFSLREGEILGIAGVVGAGRTELAEAICGIKKFNSGTIKLNGKRIKNLSIRKVMDLGLAYVPEDRHAHGIFNITSVRKNITSTILNRLNGLFIPITKENEITKKYVNDLKIKAEGTNQELSDLSGGNQQKVVLAKYLATEPKVIILDEPTRGIDASARADIYRIINQLKERGLAVLLISSDTEEIVELSDRVLVMQEGKINKEIEKEKLTVDNITSAAFGVKKDVIS